MNKRQVFLTSKKSQLQQGVIREFDHKWYIHICNNIEEQESAGVDIVELCRILSDQQQLIHLISNGSLQTVLQAIKHVKQQMTCFVNHILAQNTIANRGLLPAILKGIAGEDTVCAVLQMHEQDILAYALQLFPFLSRISVDLTQYLQEGDDMLSCVVHGVQLFLRHIYTNQPITATEKLYALVNNKILFFQNNMVGVQQYRDMFTGHFLPILLQSEYTSRNLFLVRYLSLLACYDVHFIQQWLRMLVKSYFNNDSEVSEDKMAKSLESNQADYDDPLVYYYRLLEMLISSMNTVFYILEDVSTDDEESLATLQATLAFGLTVKAANYAIRQIVTISSVISRGLLKEHCDTVADILELQICVSAGRCRHLLELVEFLIQHHYDIFGANRLILGFFRNLAVHNEAFNLDAGERLLVYNFINGPLFCDYVSTLLQYGRKDSQYGALHVLYAALDFMSSNCQNNAPVLQSIDTDAVFSQQLDEFDDYSTLGRVLFYISQGDADGGGMLQAIARYEQIGKSMCLAAKIGHDEFEEWLSLFVDKMESLNTH